MNPSHATSQRRSPWDDFGGSQVGTTKAVIVPVAWKCADQPRSQQLLGPNTVSAVTSDYSTPGFLVSLCGQHCDI